MASNYRIQIIDERDGQVVHSWPPGRAVEAELVESLVVRVMAKPVGLFTTRTGVGAAVRDAFRELLLALKKQV